MANPRTDLSLEKAKQFAFSTITSGLIPRYFTYPAEYITIIKSKPENIKTYPILLRETFSWQKLKELNATFFSKTFWPTIGKSAANMGVVSHVEHYYQDQSPVARGVTSAGVSAVVETALTSYHEYLKVLDFLKTNNNKSKQPAMALIKEKPPEPTRAPVLSKEFGRVLTASFGRSLWAGIVTFAGINVVTENIQPLLPTSAATNPTVVKGTGAAIWGAGGQPFIMPVNNFHTAVLSNPSLSLRQTAVSLVKDKPMKTFIKNFTNGLGARMPCQGIRYGLGYALMGFFGKKDAKKTEKQRITSTVQPGNFKK